VTELEIADALRIRLLGTNAAPTIVLENQKKPTSGLFWMVSGLVLPPDRRGIENHHVHEGEFIVSVMHTLLSAATEAEQSAEIIAARFPADLDLPTENGVVSVVSQPHIPRGYDDGDYFRVNVTVKYSAQ